MSMFKGIKGARTSEGGVYLKPGVYDLTIRAVKALEDRKKIATFVVEFDVDRSTVAEHPAGTVVSWIVKLDKEPALGNIKMFIAAASGCSPEEIEEKDVEEAIASEQPLKGVKLTASANNITTRAGNPFTKITWKEFAGATPDAR